MLEKDKARAENVPGLPAIDATGRRSRRKTELFLYGDHHTRIFPQRNTVNVVFDE